MMPIIDHQSFAHYSVADGNTEMKQDFSWVGLHNVIIDGGGFDGANEVRLGTTQAYQNGSLNSFMLRKFNENPNKAVFSFDVRFTFHSGNITSSSFSSGSGFFCIMDASSIDAEISRVSSPANFISWLKGIVLTQDINRTLSVYIRTGSGSSTSVLIAKTDAQIYSDNPLDIYNHEVFLDLSSATAILKVRVNGTEVINATFNRDAIVAAYRVTQIGGCGWSSPSSQNAVVNLSNVLTYTEDADMIYPAGPLTLSPIETGLGALETNPANPGTYDVIPAAGKTYAMNDVGPSIPPGSAIYGAYIESRMGAALGGQPEPITFELLDSASNVTATRNASLTPGLPDRILITDVSTQIGDIAAVNGAQVRIRRAS